MSEAIKNYFKNFISNVTGDLPTTLLGLFISVIGSALLYHFESSWLWIFLLILVGLFLAGYNFNTSWEKDDVE